MRYLLSTFFTILLLAGIVCSQEIKCPGITVAGPPGILGPDDLFVFKVEVTGLTVAPSYHWQISGGEIVDGQGTNSIRVRHIETGSNLTVTVQVFGIPQGCPDSASETTTGGCGLPLSTVLQEHSGVFLDGLAETTFAMRENPGAMIAVEIEISEKDSFDPVRSKIRQSVKKLSTFADYDVTRLYFIVRKSKDRLTSIYLVPPGAARPRCENDKNCIAVEGAKTY